MWLRDKLNDMLGHIIGTGAPHTAAGVGADAAGTAAGAVNAHKDLTAAVHGVAAPDAIESTSGAQDKADAAQTAAVVAGENSVTAAAARGFFLFDAASDVGGYRALSRIPSAGAQKTAVVTVDANPKLLGAWATEAGVPGAILLPTHTARARLRLSEAAGGKTATVFARLYQRTAGGVETLLGQSGDSAALGAAEATYDPSLNVPEVLLASTDRLVLKAYATPAGAGADPVVTVYFEGVGLLSSTAGIGVACGAWQSGNAAVRYDEIMSGALGGALTGGNPALSKLSRPRKSYGLWHGAIAVTIPGWGTISYSAFDKLCINTTLYDYYLLLSGYVSNGLASTGIRVMNMQNDTTTTELWRAASNDIPDRHARTDDAGASYPNAAAELAAVTDAAAGTHAPLDSLGTVATDWWATGYPRTHAGVRLQIAGNVNANAANLAVEYWNGAAWVAVAGLVDGTTVAGATCAQTGNVAWTSPGAAHAASVIAGISAAPYFYFRFSVSAALSATVDLQEVRVLVDDWQIGVVPPYCFVTRPRSIRSLQIPEAILTALPAGVISQQLQIHADGTNSFSAYFIGIEGVPK